ncbi:hypothetical protein Q428_09670 [Fervidicella metallireducens AeB]|uniref:Uncharacterized protein n=1 Tax=Fervidicella metallireducens AeB TaxID=1403537 RepID=A0A017RU75_9CLOT|nr:HD-GYP domain-containing protein [Fervidicella metallireducens]EYE88141.1 hypothetical protein Q428_09670 [Fervidicella metallireducens AeB]
MKNKKLILYLATMYILSAVCFIFAFKYDRHFLDYSSNTIIGIIFFILLSAFLESMTFVYKQTSISTGFSVTLASILIFGPFLSMVIISIGATLRIVKINNKYIHFFNTPLHKKLFNISNFSISIFLSSFYFKNYLGFEKITSIKFFYILIVVMLFLLVNSIIISLLIAIITGDKFSKILLSNLRMGVLNILAMAPFGLLLAYLYQNYNILGIIVLIIPITLSRYTFQLYIESKNKYLETVKALMNAMEARDKYTEGHSRRVAEIVEKIAKELKYSESKIEQLNIASLLHDVGKIGIDDSILNKPGNLNDEEYGIIKKHPLIGYEILKEIKDLDEISFIVKHHHERYDGKGYPDGKKAEELNLDVFIVQLADSIDAMSTDRPYRRALSEDEVLSELVKNKGTQFHPTVVDAYIRALKKVN